MNVLLFESEDVTASGHVVVSGARARHLIEVLRVGVHSTVRIGVIDGPHGTATVRAVAGGEVDLQCEFENDPPARPRIDVLLALPRPKVLKRLWAQIAALGVGRIMLTNAERVERNYFDTHVLSPACYRPLLIEGLQQARDTLLPVVSIHRQFRVLVEDELDRLASGTFRLLADPRAHASVAGVVAGWTGERILVAIGPEGGWNDFEVELLAAHGFHLTGLGQRTLRLDTACIALLALVQEAMHERTFRTMKA